MFLYSLCNNTAGRRRLLLLLRDLEHFFLFLLLHGVERRKDLALDTRKAVHSPMSFQNRFVLLIGADQSAEPITGPSMPTDFAQIVNVAAYPGIGVRKLRQLIPGVALGALTQFGTTSTDRGA